MSGRHSPLWPAQRTKPPYGAVTIDRAHPLSRSLVAAYLLHESAGTTIRNLVTPAYPFTKGANAIWHPEGLSCAAASGGIATATTLMGSPTQFSFVTGVRLAAVGISQNLIDIADRSTLKIESNNQVTGSYYDTTWRAISSGATVVTVGANWDMAFTVQAGAQALYMNGKVVASGTVAGTPAYAGTTTALGRHGGGDANQLNGVMKFAYIYNAVLSASLVEWLYAEPYCFLRPALRRSYGFKAAAAGGTSILRQMMAHHEG